MMKIIILSLGWITGVLFSMSCTADDLAWLNDYNVVWTSPSRDSSESMPCGGGDIGLNVWVEKGELLCYVQRSGCFDENNEYLKLGRLRIRLEPNPFDNGTSFRQELKLREGYVEVTGSKAGLQATVKVWTEIERSVIHVETDSSQPVEVVAAYENWRQTDKSLPNIGKSARWGCFSWDSYPGEVIRFRDDVCFAGNMVLFYHRNRDDKLLFDYIVRQQGLEGVRDQLLNTQKGRTFGGLLKGKGFIEAGTSEGEYQKTPYKGWHLRSKQKERRHHLELFTHIAQTEGLQQWRDGLDAVMAEQNASLDSIRRDVQDWWALFWNRSHIVTKQGAGDEGGRKAIWEMGRNYQLFRYQLGCNLRGEYPTKFNGGNFTFDAVLVNKLQNHGPDFRAWGGGSFTAQNQRLVHWPVLKAGDADLLLPQFEFYRRALPAAVARVKTYWGHEGCLFTEQMESFGLPLASAWGFAEPGSKRARGQEIPFGDARADAMRGYANVVEHGVQANNAVSYHWESQLEFSYMMLESHRFHGTDIRPYLSLIKKSVKFFDEHYKAREQIRSGRPLDADGRLVFYPSTSCESYRGAHNPVDLIAGLDACLESLLGLDGTMVSLEDRNYYSEYRKRLPVYTYTEVNGDRIIQPAKSWKRYQNKECPQFYPLFPFDRFVLGRDDMAVFRNTWKHGTFPKDVVMSWHQDGIFFARMGMVPEAADFNRRKLESSRRRFPTFWGPGCDWVPDHNWGGSGMIGLQEMLMQTPGRRIIMLPAWPATWDCDFKLHAPYKTVVEGRVRSGRLEGVIVTPEERRADVEIMGASVNKEKMEYELK